MANQPARRSRVQPGWRSLPAAQRPGENAAGDSRIAFRGVHAAARAEGRRRKMDGRTKSDLRNVRNVRNVRSALLLKRRSTRPRPDKSRSAICSRKGRRSSFRSPRSPWGKKGARITSHIALPGRHVVYMPTLEHMGVSRKIGSDEERLRLKARILQSKRPGPVGGFITRNGGRGPDGGGNRGGCRWSSSITCGGRTSARGRTGAPRRCCSITISISSSASCATSSGDSFKAIWIDSEETYRKRAALRRAFSANPGAEGEAEYTRWTRPFFDAPSA